MTGSSHDHDPGLYARSFADVYDAWYEDLHDVGEIVAAFAARCTPGATIIELGSGSGRLSTPLAHSGFHVVAIDSAISMLDQDFSSSRKIAADMAELPLCDASADAALIAYNTLFNLAGSALQQRCITEAARVLRPGGLLAIEAFIAPETDPETPFGVSVVPHHTHSDRRMAILTWHDPAEGEVITGAHVELGPEGVRTRPWQLVYRSPSSIDEAAAAAGFELAERRTDWSGTEFDPAGVRHVSWYRRALPNSPKA